MHFLFLLFITAFCFAEEKIFFSHIPKTGGLTIRSLLENHYSQDDISIGLSCLFNKKDPIIDPFSNKKLICGHFFYSKAGPYTEDYRKITFLRDPVERILSEHHYIFDREHRDRSRILKQHYLPLEGDPIDTAANIACKFLSRLDPSDPLVPIEQHLESAKDVLMNDFDFIGITEEMDESIALLCNFLGWELPTEIAIHNVTDRKQTQYSQDVLEGISKRNWADIELYQFAKKLFEVEKQNRVSYIKKEEITWVNEIDYDFKQPLDGFGWCNRENWPEGIFRWLCSSEKGHIEFPLIARFDYHMQLRLLIKTSLLPILSISVNNIVLSHQVKSLDDLMNEYQWYVCHVHIPQEVLQEGKKTKLTIAIDDVDRIPVRDSYRGRCGLSRILINVHPKNLGRRNSRDILKKKDI